MERAIFMRGLNVLMCGMREDVFFNLLNIDLNY